MHPSVYRWVEQMVGQYSLRHAKHLDIGSRDVNGGTRDLFASTHGVDIEEGPGVDEVLDAHQLRAGQYGVVTCTEMLEHDTRPWLTVAGCNRALCKGGYLLLTTRGFDETGCFPVHEYPGDYWRFSCTGVAELLISAGFDVLHTQADPEDVGVFAVGRKPS
jgi:hypothetical protein